MKALFQLPIRLLTHNIRYATTSPFKGEERWPVRAPRLINELRYSTLYNAESFICLQEVLNNQLVDIMDSLNGNSTGEGDKWAYIGVGREDGKKSGEYSPILYRPAVWKVMKFETKWLSETPDKPSKGWDAASTRIVTIGVLQHRHTEKQILAMNTHMDDQGTKARLEGARLIIRLINEFIEQYKAPSRKLPVFLAGDFNSEPNQEAYGVLNAADSPVRDLREDVPAPRRYGDENTFTGFGFENEPTKRIDFLFLGKGEFWNVKEYAVLENRFEDGVYNSDHRAVVGDVLLAV
jgi:endonuclease/exonuclease/phosphatase family metal-dependent hydrolase